MRSLIHKIFNLNFSKKIRNSINFFPEYFFIPNEKNFSISDSFLWRTDKNFKTIFKFTDIPKLFFNKENTKVVVKFFDKNFKLLKNLEIKNINIYNSLVIDKKFIGISDYGIFFIFHKFNDNQNDSLKISNRCYLGFSQNENLPSYVHGNVLAIAQINDDNKLIKNILQTSFFNNQIYKIQNCMSDFELTELFFTNPTDKKIKIMINKKHKFILDSFCSKIIEFKRIDQIEIQSNCVFLRPLIFNYKSNFFDVYHS